MAQVARAPAMILFAGISTVVPLCFLCGRDLCRVKVKECHGKDTEQDL